MWLSKQGVKNDGRDGSASVGTVTIGGASAAVLSGCEYRSARLFGPGGLAWSPSVGSSALIIKTPGGEAVAGVASGDMGLAPGEIMLYCGGGSVKLAADGGIYLTGNVYVNGEQLGGGDGA